MLILSFVTWIRNAAAALVGSYGTVAQQAQQAGCSRQTVYQHAHKVQQALVQVHQVCPHCQQLHKVNQQLRQQLQDCQQRLDHVIELGVQRQGQLAVLLAALGVSLNQMLRIFVFLLGSNRVPGRSSLGRWVRQAEQQAGQILRVLDEHSRPLARLLCPDEIFFHRQPVLTGVEPASMALLLCQRTANRQGDTWAQALGPFVNLEAVCSDAGTGIAKGLRLFQEQRRTRLRLASKTEPKPLDLSLDVFHTEAEAQRVLGRLWRGVEKVWHRAEAASARVEKDKREWYDARGAAASARAAWAKAFAALARYERQEVCWRRAKAALAVWRPDGQLNDRPWAAAEIAAACGGLPGTLWQKVRNLLQDRRSLTFLDRLARLLSKEVPDELLRGSLVRLWSLEHRPVAGSDGAKFGACVLQRLLCARLCADWCVLYEAVGRVLRGVVRSSSVVECVNSVLRMHQGRHRSLSQGLLDLKRLYWNCRAFAGGRRRGRCPYELLGVLLPTYDFQELLQRNPEELAQELSTLNVAS
jgi:hypothetical protein